jgi:predicted alpha/beta hydrolase
MLVQDTTIEARDGRNLAVTIVAPSDRMPERAVLIAPATAVPRKIYSPFARYLASRGATVLTLDYRGVGGSAPDNLKTETARMRDWAALDLAGAIDHLRGVWPGLPMSYVGHSFGGQALGLLPNNREIGSAVIIAAQAGAWRLLASPEKYRVRAIMAWLVPAIVRVKGYLPGSIGLGESLPAGVAREWAGWVLKERYFFDDPTLESLANFPHFTGNLRAIGMTDDSWATREAIGLLLSGFRGAKVERREVHPREAGTRRIGHFGWFRPENRSTLWPPAADFLFGSAV